MMKRLEIKGRARCETARHRASRPAGLILFAALSWAPFAHAWNDHALITRGALDSDARLSEKVTAESLDDFLVSQAAAIETLLDDEERWASRTVKSYAPRPQALRFRADGPRASIRARFLAALRVNPDAKLPLYLKDSVYAAAFSASKVDWKDVTSLRAAPIAQRESFSLLRSGESTSALEVLVSASDEPDYGMDVGLWKDNQTQAGDSYGFGRQPFGNPALENATQAPFHMGFYHEPLLIRVAAPYLNRTLPEYRIHLYRSLSRLALATHHRYWGWRFAGWGLHYVQDLTQPYHARSLPGVSTAKLLAISTADLIGFKKPKSAAIQRVSNRHLILESYAWGLLVQTPRVAPEPNSWAALKNHHDRQEDKPFTDQSPRDEVSEAASALAQRTDDALVHAFPAGMISDPNYVFREMDPGRADVMKVVAEQPVAAQNELHDVVLSLMAQAGMQSRRYMAQAFNP